MSKFFPVSAELTTGGGGGSVEVFSSPCGPCRTRDWGGGEGGGG